MEPPWSAADVAEFKKIYGSRTDGLLALHFNRTEEEVGVLAVVLSLSKNKASFVGTRKMPRWKSDEVAILLERYALSANLEIARELGRSVKSVVSKAHALGLRKSEARLEVMGRENITRRGEGQKN